MTRERWRFGRREDELSEEMSSHLAMAIRERVARGEPLESATAAARREFGNREVVRAATRDVWGWMWAEQLMLDFRHALRRLKRAPGFTAVASLSLAIGIGATVTMYGVVDAADVRKLPYPSADRLVVIQEATTRDMPDGHGGPVFGNATSAATFADWHSQAHAFDGMALAGYTGGVNQGLHWAHADETELLHVSAVSPEFFSLLGATPILGRGVIPNDTVASAGRVLILSYALWRDRFGSDRNVVGTSLQLTASDELSAPRETYTIIGVMPRQVDYPGAAQGWEAVRATVPTAGRGARGYDVLARLRPGQTVAAATAELTTITRRLADQYPDDMKNVVGARVRTLSEALQTPYSRESYTISSARGRAVRLAIVGVVLLVAMINVGNLLLARAAAREHEMSVRTALGASRRRLIQALLIESSCIALIGGSLGVALSWWGIGVAASLGDFAYQGIVPMLDGRVLAFALLLTAVVALGVGLIPAASLIRTRRAKSHTESPGATAGRSRARLQGVLLAAQIAAALTLLTGAGLLSKELIRLLNAGFDFDPANMVIVPYPRPPRKVTDETRRQFRDDAIERLALVPGVVSVSELGNFGESFFPPGHPEKAESRVPLGISATVSPRFLKNLRVPLRRGRDFTDADFGSAAPVCIVSTAAAERFWPGEDPIGKQVAVAPGFVRVKNGPKPDTLILTVVGMMGNPRFAAVLGPPPITLLRPNTSLVGFDMYYVRTSTKSDVTMAAVRRVFAELRGAPLVRDSYGSVQSMQIDHQLAEQRITTRALIAFAAVALLLAALGIHGLVAYSVAQRTREIGIRMALGAESRNVLLLVTQRGLLLAALGIALGVTGSLTLTRVLSAMLYGTSPTDPVVFVGSATLLATVVLVASYLPARRATHVDPMVALRVE